MGPFIEVAAGLVILFAAGDCLVRGAVSLAARLGLSPLVISLTVVAFGTSAPELVVSVNAALQDVSGLALGNVVGSNIANVLLVLGLPALVYPLKSSDHDARINIYFMLGASAVLFGLAFTGRLAWWHGVLLLAGLAAFIGLSFHRGRRAYSQAELQDVEGMPAKPYKLWLAITFTLAGLVGLVWGSDLLVGGATTLARRFGVSEAVIGLTLVAVGTSLPELVTSFMAALHRHADVALGNIIGSNIFNILGILGVASVLAPIDVSPDFLTYDLPAMMVSALVLSFFVLRHKPIGLPAGILMLTAYVGYIAGLGLMA
jgi:cation:H+ antiporter